MDFTNVKRTFTIANRYGMSGNEILRALFPNAKKDGLLDKFAAKAKQFGDYLDAHPGLKKLGIAMAVGVGVRMAIGADVAFADSGDMVDTSSNTVDLNVPNVETNTAATASMNTTPETSFVAETTTPEVSVDTQSAPDATVAQDASIDNTNTQVVDGVEVESDEPVVVVDENQAQETTNLETETVATTSTVETDKTININDLGDSKSYSVPAGEVTEIVYSGFEQPDQAEVMVFYGPEGKTYVALTPTAGLSYDNCVEYFKGLYSDGKIPYNPYDETTFPAEIIAKKAADPNFSPVEWLPGVRPEGQILETEYLGNFIGSWDADGNLHLTTDGQAVEVINTSDGLTREEMPDPNTIEAYKGVKPDEPVIPDEPDVPVIPDVPVTPETPNTVVSGLPVTGDDPFTASLLKGLAGLAGTTAAGAAMYGATHKNVTLDPDGNYGFIPYEEKEQSKGRSR